MYSNVDTSSERGRNRCHIVQALEHCDTDSVQLVNIIIRTTRKRDKISLSDWRQHALKSQSWWKTQTLQFPTAGQEILAVNEKFIRYRFLRLGRQILTP